MKLQIAQFILLVLVSTTIIAQINPRDSVKTTLLDEVVITAQFAPKLEKNAIYKVKVIRGEAIEKKASANLTELLRHQLNIDLSYNPAFGAGIEMNGISKENIKILIDGVPLIGRVNGVLNLNQINLDNIERIEVVEGPVSVFYGTDAMGGTINLITKKRQNKIFKGSLKTYYESVEASNSNASIGYTFSENLIKLDAGTYSFNGINTDDNNKRLKTWPEKNQYYTNFKFIKQIGAFKLRFSSDFSEEKLSTLGEVSSRSKKATDIDYTTKRWDNSVNFQGKLKNDNFLDLTVSYLDYDRYDTSYQFNSVDNTSNLIVNNPNENGNYFTTFFAKGQYAKSNSLDNLNYVLGFEQQSDYAEGNRILDGKKEVKNTSFFASVNYKLSEQLEIQPAVRYTYNSSFKSLWSPAFNAKYRFDNEHVIRFAYGNGYRAPSIKELYLDWMPTLGPFTYTFKGNENLQVESSHNLNLNYTFRRNLDNGRFFQLESTFFFNTIKNLIGLSQLVNFERHYINLNKTKTISSNVSIQHKVSENLQYNIGVSYLGRYLEYTDVFNSGGYLFNPGITINSTYHFNPLKVNLNVFYKFTGKRDGNYIEKISNVDVLKNSTRASFNNLDVSLSRSFSKKAFLVSVGAKNLFNVTDVETFNQIGAAHERNIQLWGTSYYVQAKINF